MICPFLSTRSIFLELKDVSVTLVDKIEPWLAVEQLLDAFKEGFGVEVKQDWQCLLISHKVDDVHHMRYILGFQKLTDWEFLTFEENAEDPQQLVANVEVWLFYLIFSILIGLSQEINILFGYFSPLALAIHDLVLVSNSLLSLHIIQQHGQDLHAAFPHLLRAITRLQLK